MDETTVAAMVAAGAAAVSGVISWLNRRDARNANLEGQMREGFAKAEAERKEGFAKAEAERKEGFAKAEAERKEGFARAETEREKLRSQMDVGFTRAESHREKQKDDLLADRREWTGVHEARIQNLEKSAIGTSSKSPAEPSPSLRSRPPSPRRRQAGQGQTGVQRSKRPAATAAKGP